MAIALIKQLPKLAFGRLESFEAPMNDGGKKNSGDQPNGGGMPGTSAGKTRILVADDHPLVREALIAIIDRQADFVCCGEASSTAETQKATTLLKPDLILLDLWLDDGDGLALIRTLTKQYPGLRILVISQSEGTLPAEQALRAGACGFVMKEQPAAEILAAIRTVLAGGCYVSPKAAPTKDKPVENGTSPVGRLTDRELQVLRLLGAGMGTRKIAGELGLSSKTVESHRENIKHKMGLSDSQGLLHYATYWSRNLQPSKAAQVVT